MAADADDDTIVPLQLEFEDDDEMTDVLTEVTVANEVEHLE